MSLISYVQSVYIKSAWTREEALYARRGFVSALEQGWANADGSQQYIALARFATRLAPRARSMSRFQAGSIRQIR